MNACRFDDVTVMLSRSPTRRVLLRAFAALTVGGFLSHRRTASGQAEAPEITGCRALESSFEHPRPVLRAPFRTVKKDERVPCGLDVSAGTAPKVSSGYGGHEEHTDAKHNEHFAVDFSITGMSFPVLAAAKGLLRRHDDSEGVGLYIRHNDNWQTKYLHLDPKCGLINYKDSGRAVTSADPPFEVEAGTVIGWVSTSLSLEPHLHFALRGGATFAREGKATTGFTSLKSSTCCGTKNCNWTYPIPEIAPGLPVPDLTFTPCSTASTCAAIDTALTRVNACCAPKIVPGGMWKRAEIAGDTLRLAATAYPTHDREPAIQRVAFTLWWPEYGPRGGPWEIGCTDYKANSAGEYTCDLDLTTTGAPHGEITVSFDVYDVDKNYNLAPHGAKTLEWSDSGCGVDEIFCNGNCVNRQKSWDHCGRCNNRCGIFQICCDGTCGCDGTTIIPGYCWNAPLICEPL